MRIKKIELIGFKSFADRTEIHLHEGITCIVGPNGCGKSNISDALRWVFGERSAKLLRGARMEDVIFAGSDLRKPMGMAEVSITVDNSDHQLPISYDEVVIARRLDRSGQSQYFINKTQCRLRDILDLILDTGMGSNSYSMIEQGRVDKVINADPKERRFLIEEAAGISKYKVKKEEALRKLERTEQNLLRIRDIVAEVQRNIHYAERQAKRAERYKVQFEELKKLEIGKAFLDLSELKGEQHAEETAQQEWTGQVEKLEKELKALSEKRDEQKRALDLLLEEEAQRSSRYFEVRSESQALAQQREFDRERVQAGRNRRIEIEKERELLEANLSELSKEIQAKAAELEKALAEHQEAQTVLARENEIFEGTEKQFRVKQAEAETVKALLFENASALADLRNETNRLRMLLETGVHQQERRKGSFEKTLGGKENLEKKKISYGEELAAVERELKERREGKEKGNLSLGRWKEEAAVLEKALSEKRSNLHEINSRLVLLQELEETAEESEQKLLATLSSDKLQGKLVRRLREVVRIQEGYESAVEAVLGSFAQSLVAEDVETAKSLMQKMAQSHAGPCGIFIQSLARANGKHLKTLSVAHPEIRHSIKEVVQIQAGFEALFEPLFENVYVVEAFAPEQLADLMGVAQETKLVTKQGILLGPEARIFFRNGRLSPDQGPFHRQAEIQNLKSASARLDEEIQTEEKKREGIEKEIRQGEVLLEALEEQKRDLLVRKEATESLLRSLSERLAASEEEIRILEFETQESSQESSATRKRLTELLAKIQEFEGKEKDFAADQARIETATEKIRRDREEQIHDVARLKARAESHEERLRALESAATLVKSQLEKTTSRLSRLKEEEEELIQKMEELQKQEGGLQERETALRVEQDEAEKALTEIRGRKAFQEEALRHLTAQAEEGERALKTLRESLHEKEMKLMDLSYREKSIFERLDQTYHVKLAELRAEEFLQENADRSSLDEAIAALKAKVESFGAVNLLAVEEYEELKQRYEFLAGQEKDLNEGRESLLEAIRKINRTTKSLFDETFAKAKALFQEYYQTLFEGGYAELVLIEGQEGEEAGIDILVRPPGKKPQHISLLSGGEKTLTAIALLFALFRIKPSPLCVLDEVDAALDEANVDRFLRVLKTFLDASQFLVVTHNRKTIAMGDFLYGVTMEEAGVSKIVSVKVGQPERKPEVESNAVTA